MILDRNHKVDPYIRSMVKVTSDQPLRVILYAKRFDKCLPFLNNLGIAAATELPFMGGYIVEITTSLLPKLAKCRHLKYIAADLDVKACI